VKLAVIGDPVAHSASPALHRAFLAEAGIEGTYEAIRVLAGDGARAIDDLRSRGYAGLNVTTPLKEEAYARADERDAAAIAAGSANTLVFGPRIVAYNTDGIGAIGALRAAGLDDVAGRMILVLGAGPTARSCIVALEAAGAATYLWNRTRATAERLAASLGTRVWQPSSPPPAAPLSALPPHATFADAELRRTLTHCSTIVDANYGDRSTLGEILDRPVHDGTDMLKASAAASFARFTSRGELSSSTDADGRPAPS